MTDFCMPSLGADMEAGVVVEWLVAPGDRVSRGDIVVVVETEKANIDVEIWSDGVVEELLVLAGERAAVGAPLMRLRDEPAASEPAAQEELGVTEPGAPEAPEAPEAPAESEAPEAPEAPVAPAEPDAPGAPSLPPRSAVAGGRAESADRAAEEGWVRASPAARRAAQRASVSLSSIAGSGPGGAVVLRDVEAKVEANVDAVREPAFASLEPEASPEPLQPGDAMRSAIAAAMTRSKREIPHYYLATRIDLSAAATWLEQANLERPISERLVMAPVLLKAVALALKKHPELNGYYSKDRLVQVEGVHIGVAVSLKGGGLVAPAIHECDRKSPVELMAALKDLVNRARRGGLRASEMSDATVTVSSLGDRGVDLLHGVIYPPQVALVGFGTPLLEPWVCDDRVEPRWVVHASLAADHRATDGHLGARFLRTVAARLARPAEL